MRRALGVFATVMFATCPALTAIAQLPPTVAAAAPRNEARPYPDVTPGDNILIACDAVQKRAADSDVRVVLTISAVPGETAPGYAKVLATDEEVLKDAVRVRIPQLPSLEDHTVGLDVYVVGSANDEHCDAGHMKIS
ncbi:MAG TPA: hypothetical protein VHT03_11295 [Rhizomicrobium sp.]|jgi:hypothetical protein|nr:hypothetical protein [Rhizomicrobium sp.]